MSKQKKHGEAVVTMADQPMAMTFRRVEWARIAVALRLVAKQIDSAEHLRLSQEISKALNEGRIAELERGGMWVDLPGYGHVRVQVLEVLDEPD